MRNVILNLYLRGDNAVTCAREAAKGAYLWPFPYLGAVSVNFGFNLYTRYEQRRLDILTLTTLEALTGVVFAGVEQITEMRASKHLARGAEWTALKIEVFSDETETGLPQPPRRDAKKPKAP